MYTASKATGAGLFANPSMPAAVGIEVDPAIQEALTDIRQCVSLRSLTALVKEMAEIGMMDDDQVIEAVRARRKALSHLTHQPFIENMEAEAEGDGDAPWDYAAMHQGIGANCQQALRAADFDCADIDV
jgi:hypothetical protein